MPDKFDMSDYVPVSERIDAFKADWPDGSLQSTIVELTETRVTVKAYAYRTADDQRPGIGHSSVVIPGATPYTRGSEIENAETSAWGRAIAALGFEVKRGLASREEVRNKQPGQGERAGQEGLAPSAKTSAPATPEVMAHKRYEWAAQFGWSHPALDQASLDATNTPVGELDHDGWAIFAAAVVKGGPGLSPDKQPAPDERAGPLAATPPATTPAPVDQEASGHSSASEGPAAGDSPSPAPVPPKPGTAEYKALPDGGARADARAYWQAPMEVTA